MNQKHMLLITIGSAGDVYPKIGLGRALLARGHRVTLVTSAFFEELIRAEGFDFVPLGTKEHYFNITQNPDLFHPTKGFQTIARWGLVPFTQPVIDAIEANLADNLVVVSSGMAFGARIARERFSFPLISAHLQPSVLRTVYDCPDLGGFRLPDWLPHGVKRAYYNLLDKAFIDRELAGPINQIRAQYGLAPTQHFMGDYFHSPDKVIGLFPDWYAPIQPDWPASTVLTGFVEFDTESGDELAPDVQAFLAAGTAPIVFTAGSSNQHGHDYFAASVAAATRLGRRAILVTRNPAAVPAQLPEGIIHLDYVPFSRLLPHAAAIVHHGGIGTVAKSIASSVPQVITPLSHDQPDNAMRIKRLGLGAAIQPRQYNVKRATETLQSLLTDEALLANVRAYAARIDFAAMMAQTCDEIERTAASFGPAKVPDRLVDSEGELR